MGALASISTRFPGEKARLVKAELIVVWPAWTIPLVKEGLLREGVGRELILGNLQNRIRIETLKEQLDLEVLVDGGPNKAPALHLPRLHGDLRVGQAIDRRLCCTALLEEVEVGLQALNHHDFFEALDRGVVLRVDTVELIEPVVERPLD